MRLLLTLMVLVAVTAGAFGQEAAQNAVRDPAGAARETGGALQAGFRDLRLGMSMDAAKEVLRRDPNFAYRGDPDVSFLPASGLPIIETAGVAFIERAILQFSDDSLYVLTLVLNEARLDYFSVYSSLSEQYGEPTRLDPGMATWESDAVTLSLERPVTVKYVDAVVFGKKLEAGIMTESLETLTRERFLEQL